MINVTPAMWQADSHLLEFAGGKRVLIDAGEAKDAPSILLPYLQGKGIDSFDLVVISHFHWDHYGQLKKLVSNGIKIGRIAMNLPASREVADQERPWGMDWDEVQELLGFLREKNIPLFTPAAGDCIFHTEGPIPVRLEVVCRFDGVNTPVGKTFVNDTSIVLRLVCGETTALLTGDLDYKLGQWLVEKSGLDLRADILKMPHHGGAGNPPNEFYERVNPVVALVPTSEALWRSPRCARVRTFVSDHRIPCYVTGVDGNVILEIGRTEFRVKAERRTTTDTYLPRQR